MKRLWGLVCLLGLIGIAAGASSVLAGSSRTTVTYWSDAIACDVVPGERQSCGEA